jgi:hypothetical protein
MSAEGIPAGTYISFQAIDHNGQPIEWVDRAGEPVSKETIVASHPLQRPGNYELLYDPARFQRQPDSEGTAFAVYCNVNPRAVSRLAVKLVKSARVTITGFPLDPK